MSPCSAIATRSPAPAAHFHREDLKCCYNREEPSTAAPRADLYYATAYLPPFAESVRRASFLSAASSPIARQTHHLPPSNTGRIRKFRRLPKSPRPSLFT